MTIGADNLYGQRARMRRANPVTEAASDKSSNWTYAHSTAPSPVG